MTKTNHDKIKRLFKLVDLHAEFDTLVDFKLVDQWCELREEHGLAKTLNLIREYVKQTSQSPIQHQTPQTNQPNQNRTPMQRM
jgi:hypothetical protein